MLIPHHMNPLISGKGHPRVYPHISGIGFRWQLQKHPLFLVFGKSSRVYGQKIPPFPRKWELACGPIMLDPGSVTAFLLCVFLCAFFFFFFFGGGGSLYIIFYLSLDLITLSVTQCFRLCVCSLCCITPSITCCRFQSLRNSSHNRTDGQNKHFRVNISLRDYTLKTNCCASDSKSGHLFNGGFFDHTIVIASAMIDGERVNYLRRGLTWRRQFDP